MKIWLEQKSKKQKFVSKLACLKILQNLFLLAQFNYYCPYGSFIVLFHH